MRSKNKAGLSILSLSTSPWAEPYWTSRQFLMYELARLAPVTYATIRYDLRDLVRLSHVWGRARAAPFAAPPGLEVLSSRWPRTYRYRVLDCFLFKAYVRRLQSRLDSGGRRVIYAWHPACLDSIKGLSYDVLVYHPYDMFRTFVNATEVLVQQEEELCRLATAIVTPHSRIAEVLENKHIHVMNNGTFLPAFPKIGYVKPMEALTHLAQPIIGTVGAINDKIDFPLLFSVFSTRPDWQLVFVGFEGPGNWKHSDAYRQLRALDNVHFLKAVPIDRIASVIVGFDVGIIPYSLSGWAQYSESPLKLYQYWAMGVPAVCSALPTLESQPGALEICRSTDEWLLGIQRQLDQRSAQTYEALRTRAEQHSWAHKAEQVMDIIRDIA